MSGIHIGASLTRAGRSHDRPAARKAVWTVRRCGWRARHAGLLATGRDVFFCSLGASGISVFKRESDGATPAARMKILSGFFRRDRLALTRGLAGLLAINASLGWCDAPGHPCYNRPVVLPFRASHERMARNDGLYDLCFVLDWNFSPRARAKGSAIFLHVSSPDVGPTAGCIALPLAIIRRLAGRRLPGRTIRVLA